MTNPIPIAAAIATVALPLLSTPLAADPRQRDHTGRALDQRPLLAETVGAQATEPGRRSTRQTEPIAIVPPEPVSPNPVTEPRSLTVDANIELGSSSNLFRNDTLLLWTDPLTGATSLGDSALASTGPYAYADTAVGFGALFNNVGSSAYNSNNTAVGSLAMFSNTTGDHNVAMGYGGLYFNSNGFYNTGVGDRALLYNTSGYSNTGVGANALRYVETGGGNTALGSFAGYSATATSMSNVFINSLGGAESNTLRIGSGTGTDFQQLNRAFIQGINGVTTGVDDAVAVLIDSAGQLGTASSSARVKENIHDLGRLSAPLADLRPVAFRYRRPFADGNKPIQFGLVAEEVAEVFPELVVFKDGKPETVKYHLLSTLLLNEVQKQEAELEDLRTIVADLTKAVADLRRRDEVQAD